MRALLNVAAPLIALAAIPLLGAAAPVITAPVPPTPPGGCVDAPRTHWLTNPGWNDLRAALQAVRGGRRDPGHATMECSVAEDGSMTNCTITEETPPGSGFGPAALLLAPKFRMSPATVCGRSNAGARIRIPIRFRKL